MRFLLSKTHRHLAIVLSIALFWFSLFLFSGSLLSGFHFTDDHDFVAIYHHLTAKHMSVMAVITQWLQEDHATGRFRTFYFIHRILETKLLGIHFLWWSIYTGFLAVLTTVLFYSFGILLGFSMQESLLLALLTNVGAQSAIWWQLGPAETIATFLLSASLVFVALSARNNRWQDFYAFLAVTFALLMSLSKENFIFMLPAIAFTKVFLFGSSQKVSWYQAIRSNAVSLSILLSAFCVEVLFVKYAVGLAPEIGYAGFSGFQWTGAIAASKSLSQGGSWWLIGLGFTLAIVVSLSNDTTRAVDAETALNTSAKPGLACLKIFATPIALFILIVIPQIIVYAKSGISQRYLYPGILAYSLLIICLYRYVRQNSQVFGKIILSLIIASLVFNLNVAWVNARTFALEGKATNALLRSVEANSKPNDPILIVTNTNVYWEWNISIKKYLNYIGDRNNLYLVSYGQQSETPWSRKIMEFYNDQTLDKLQDKKLAHCIVIFPLLKDAFLRNSSSWFVGQTFKEFLFGNFNRNLNPDSIIHLYCKK